MELSPGRLNPDKMNGHNSVIRKMKALRSSETLELNNISTENTINLINTYRGNVKTSVYLYLLILFMSEE